LVSKWGDVTVVVNNCGNDENYDDDDNTMNVPLVCSLR
jgi:hypothetical protein